MKWVTHEIVTGVMVYAVTEDLLLTTYSMAGAILPDKVEGNPYKTNYWQWRKRHRGWSHWAIGYAMLIGVIYYLKGMYPWLSELCTIGMYLCVGAICHIFEDAFCGKVPFITPKRKIGVKLFTVGKNSEYIFCLGLIIAVYIIHAQFMVK